MPKKDLYEEQAFEGATIIRSRKSHDICGMVLETRYHGGGSCFTTYSPSTGGYQWVSQSGDREKELAGLRSLLYADCELCNEWPCVCTPEELAQHEVEHQTWLAEIAKNTGMVV